MICLIAGTHKSAERWAKSQNLRQDEWFWPETIFDIMKRKNFHTILVADGIDNMKNDTLNRFLTAAWDCGRRR